MKYRKKPVVIEAVQYNNINKDEVEQFVGRQLESEINSCAYDAGAKTQPVRTLIIPTLEGKMLASPGDFIIRGVKGEFYPCKPDIFEKTYEPEELQMDIKIGKGDHPQNGSCTPWGGPGACCS